MIDDCWLTTDGGLDGSTDGLDRLHSSDPVQSDSSLFHARPLTNDAEETTVNVNDRCAHRD